MKIKWIYFIYSDDEYDGYDSTFFNNNYSVNIVTFYYKIDIYIYWVGVQI